MKKVTAHTDTRQTLPTHITQEETDTTSESPLNQTIFQLSMRFYSCPHTAT